MERPTCRTCACWLLRDHHEDDERAPGIDYAEEIAPDRYAELYGDNDMAGECQRFPGPPVVHVHVSRDGGYGSDTMIQTIRPDVVEKYDFEWCGEHHLFPAYLASLKEAASLAAPPETTPP